MPRELTKNEWETWLESRPECVKKLAAEFVCGQECRFVDGVVYVVGWSEDDGVLLSPSNPFIDFEGSRESYREWPAELLRKHSKVLVQ